MNEAKSLLLPSMEVKVCTHWGLWLCNNYVPVSTFLVITQVRSGLKKSHICIFSNYKYLHVKIASLANVKSCVTLGPIH